jgi:hypothetical protein
MQHNRYWSSLYCAPSANGLSFLYMSLEAVLLYTEEIEYGALASPCPLSHGAAEGCSLKSRTEPVSRYARYKYLRSLVNGLIFILAACVIRIKRTDHRKITRNALHHCFHRGLEHWCSGPRAKCRCSRPQCGHQAPSLRWRVHSSDRNCRLRLLRRRSEALRAQQYV